MENYHVATVESGLYADAMNFLADNPDCNLPSVSEGIDLLFDEDVERVIVDKAFCVRPAGSGNCKFRFVNFGKFNRNARVVQNGEAYSSWRDSSLIPFVRGYFVIDRVTYNELGEGDEFGFSSIGNKFIKIGDETFNHYNKGVFSENALIREVFSHEELRRIQRKGTRVGWHFVPIELMAKEGDIENYLRPLVLSRKDEVLEVSTLHELSRSGMVPWKIFYKSGSPEQEFLTVPVEGLETILGEVVSDVAPVMKRIRAIKK